MTLALVLACLAALVMACAGLAQRLDNVEPLAQYATPCERCGMLTTEVEQDNSTETTHAICTRCSP